MNRFTSLFAVHIERFLAYKRSLGYIYGSEVTLLRDFDRVLAALAPARDILSEDVIRELLSHGGPHSRCHRLTVARQFARFLTVEEPRTFVPPRRFLGIRRNKPVIRVLSRQEAGRFLAACGKLANGRSSPYRALVHGTALRLLLLTGLRKGEVIGLNKEDVDLKAGILTISDSKFGKSRFVPLAPDVCDRLRVCNEALETRILERRPTDAFFPAPDGHRQCDPSSLYRSFRCVLNLAEIPHHGRGQGPRLHDLRHSFAVLRLLSWYEQGQDLRAKLPLLATYLGHLGLSSSQVYLHMTRDLIGEVVRRQQDRFGELITAEATSP